jgi:2-dehydro-3-deoxygluconokinase
MPPSTGIGRHVGTSEGAGGGICAGAGAVICIGECMVELSERPDGTLRRGFGGDTLNTALYLARLGVPTAYATALGADVFSDEMVAAWRSEGIATDLVARVPGGLPGLYLIRTDPAGERQFLYWRDSAPVRRLFHLPEMAAIADAVCRAGLVYVSGITLSLFDAQSRGQLFDLLARARRGGTCVAFDTNFRPRGWPDIDVARGVFAQALAAADLVFAGVEDHLLLYGTAEPDAVMARLREHGVTEAVVKLAIPACTVSAAGLVEMVSAEPVGEIADTNAAGDSFAAGYIAARREGAAPGDAARAGHRLAGAVVRHPGAVIPLAAMPAAYEAT